MVNDDKRQLLLLAISLVSLVVTCFVPVAIAIGLLSLGLLWFESYSNYQKIRLKVADINEFDKRLKAMSEDVSTLSKKLTEDVTMLYSHVSLNGRLKK